MKPRHAPFVIAATIMLAACGLRIPDPRPYVANCPAKIDEADEAGADDIFFMASNLPDCRDDRLKFAKFRHHELSYGVTELGADLAEPWDRLHSRRYTKGAWMKALRGRLNAGDNDGRLLVFVHGYNNGFDDAIERGYKLSRLYFAGVPVLVVSWPSRNRAVSYTYDEASIGWAQDHLDDLLENLVMESDDITLVAHSMGSRAVIDAVFRLNDVDPDRADHVKKIVLASPDIDRDRVMRRNGAIDDLLDHGRKIVVYTSYRDVPIRLSRGAHGYARLGSSDCRYDVRYERRAGGREGGCHMALQREGLSIVETSAVATNDIFKHADFVDSCPVWLDLQMFLRGGEFPWRKPTSVQTDQGELVGYRIPATLGPGQEVCRTLRE